MSDLYKADPRKYAHWDKGSLMKECCELAQKRERLEAKVKELEEEKLKIKKAVSDYCYSEGCTCCQGSDHEKHADVLGTLLGFEKYDDGSGYNFNT